MEGKYAVSENRCLIGRPQITYLSGQGNQTMNLLTHSVFNVNVISHFFAKLCSYERIPHCELYPSSIHHDMNVGANFAQAIRYCTIA